MSPPQSDYGDGHHDMENGQGQHNQRKRNPLAATIEDFSPVWFAICMNSGILGILLHQLPYQFNGIHVLSDIAFVIDLVLFVIFGILMILRFIMYPKSIISSATSNPEELSFFANIPIAWLTLTALVSLNVSQAYWGGYAWTIVAYVMWWFGAGFMLAASFIIYAILFNSKMAEDRSLPTTVLIPAVGVATVATVGGLIANYSAYMTARLAVPVIIFSFIVVGQGIFLAMVIYAIFTHRLIATGFPEPAKLPSLIILVGPMGQSGAALQLLGTAANTAHRFADYDRGAFLQALPGAGVDAACILLSLLLFGFGLFWIVIALTGILTAAFKKQLTWSMTWWSTIFPMATFTTSCLVFANEMSSRTWRVITAILLIILVIDYLVCWGFTFFSIAKNGLLIPEDARKSRSKKS